MNREDLMAMQEALRKRSRKSREWIPSAPPRVVAVIKQACADQNCVLADLLARGQQAQLCAARRQAAKALRAMGFSLPTIGRFLGGLHHSTVHAMLQKQPPITPHLSDGDGIGVWDEWI